MSIIDENESIIYKKHKDLCLSLNMDTPSAEKSWEAYKEIRNNYTLEGAQTHWLCCALYVACRKSTTPTVGNSNSVVEGNFVSLTRLLRICDLSINEFFSKMKKWCEMASVPADFRERIDHLERSFAVSTLLYQKFSPIFRDLFICPPSDELRVGKGKKVKSTPCTANKVFELCWCLFICVKGYCPRQQSVDLVTSFDMLLCCVDLIFSNAIVDNRHDLINSKFPGVPPEWNDGIKIESPLCIMNKLCERHEGTKVDAMETKNYTFKNLIKGFFEKNILHGNPHKFLNILSMGNFEANLKALNNLYETYTLSSGEFDERIFLNHQEIGSSRLGGSLTKNDIGRMDPDKSNYEESIKRLVKDTPITRRESLPPNKNCLTPVATATQSVNKLRSMLNDYNGKAQPSLREIFQKCDKNPEAKIEQLLLKMSKKFCDTSLPNGPERFRLAEALYYRLLENIIKFEMKRKPLDLNMFFNIDGQSETINLILIACSIEIVLTAYNSQPKFPWILDQMEIDPYNFYKIIEIVVMCHQDMLTRDIIKHLNTIEEQCLESFIWQSKSLIWDKIKQLNVPIPSCKDVARRNDCESGVTPHNTEYGRRSDEFDRSNYLMSPYNVKDRILQSPMKALAKMQLFKTGTNIKEENCGTNSNSNNDTPSKCFPSQVANNNGYTNRVNIYGSLGLFFRKFYELAYPRMNSLCKELGLNDDDILKKIWTIFEYSIIEQTELMRDRHLDQILMCAIYVFNRVTKLNKTFTDIMKFYRNQPQSDSHVYRSVLISHHRNTSVNRNERSSETSAPVPLGPTRPGELAGTSVSHDNEERGDIIKFYNTVYVQQMQQFAMKFSNEASADKIPLSPLPQGRSTPLSPKKLSLNHSLYIQQLDRKESNDLLTNSITYTFHRSPAKDIIKMNNIIANGQSLQRRILTNDGIKRNLTIFDDDNCIKVPNKIIKTEPVPTTTATVVMNNANNNNNNNYTPINSKIKNIINDRQDNTSK